MAALAPAVMHNVTLTITAPTSTVFDHRCIINFKCLGKTESMSHEKVAERIANLLVSHERSSIIFTEIVGARTTLKVTDLGLGYDLYLWQLTGPFTAEAFLKMMTFSRDTTYESFSKHIESFIRRS